MLVRSTRAVIVTGSVHTLNWSRCFEVNKKYQNGDNEEIINIGYFFSANLNIQQIESKLRALDGWFDCSRVWKSLKITSTRCVLLLWKTTVLYLDSFYIFLIFTQISWFSFKCHLCKFSKN